MVRVRQVLPRNVGHAKQPDPFSVHRRIFHELLGGVIVPAQHQQYAALKTAPGARHLLLKRLLLRRGRRRFGPLAHQAQVTPETHQCGAGHLAAQQFDPEVFLPQPLDLVVLDVRARQACCRADPGVDKAQPAHAWVVGLVAIQQGGRCAVTQAPQGDARNRRLVAL